MERTDLVPELDAELPLEFYQLLITGVFRSLFDEGYISQHHLMEVLSSYDNAGGGLLPGLDGQGRTA